MNTQDTHDPSDVIEAELTERRLLREQERNALYQSARDLVQWGISNGLLHRPIDEGQTEETGTQMIADAVHRATRLGSGFRSRTSERGDAYYSPMNDGEDTATGSQEAAGDAADADEGENPQEGEE
jgi:hypothetical protein